MSKCFSIGTQMKGKWHGGKGSSRRKGANDTVYRDNWDKIFGQKNKSTQSNNSIEVKK